MNRFFKPSMAAFAGALWGVSSLFAYGQDDAQANNPLASTKALSFQNYYMGDFTDSNGDGIGQWANQAWLRYAQPLSFGAADWILRASLPISTYPTYGDNHETDLSDLNVFLAYLMDTGNPAVSFGFGPQITLPTATEEGFSSEKWSAGLVNVFFNGSSPRLQYGYLLSWQHSFAGEDNAPDVNMAAFQPFTFYQLGQGYYLRSTAIMTYDFERENYNIPLGLGLGKVFKLNGATLNAYAEPQYSILNEGAGQPKWQILSGLNFQF